MPFETPQNGGFLVAAYLVAAVIYLGYTVSLWVRARQALRLAQVMAEFGLDTIVILADGEGHIVEETTVKKLLPGAFTPEHLKK